MFGNSANTGKLWDILSWKDVCFLKRWWFSFFQHIFKGFGGKWSTKNTLKNTRQFIQVITHESQLAGNRCQSLDGIPSNTAATEATMDGNQLHKAYSLNRVELSVVDFQKCFFASKWMLKIQYSHWAESENSLDTLLVTNVDVQNFREPIRFRSVPNLDSLGPTWLERLADFSYAMLAAGVRNVHF